jgi:long-chain acyl-CoA synthetase
MDSMTPFNVSNFVHETSMRLPDHVAVYDHNGVVTYKQLSDKVNASAQWLTSSGISRGMGVGVMGVNSCDFIVLAFAVMQCGAVVLPLSSQLSEEELINTVRVSKLHFLLFDEHSKVGLDSTHSVDLSVLQSKWRLQSFDYINSITTIAPHVPDAALIRFTSGTTGSAKGVILSHQTINERTAAAAASLQLSEQDSVLWVLSMAFHFVVSIITYVRCGCSIIINKDFLASAMLEEADRYQATFIYASPMHIRLLANDRSGKKLQHARRVISTSTGISADQCESFYQRFGMHVHQAYGIIEVGLPVISDDRCSQHPDAIGFAAPGYEADIFDENMNLLPSGETGLFAVKGPGMFDAYLDPPALRDDVTSNGWFMTGDLAMKKADGMITVMGRKKSLINVAGNKVFPEDVETVINRHADVTSSRISGFHHPLLGESVMAEIVLKDGVSTDPEAIRTWCKQHLSSYKVPQKIIFTDSLPMTASGKIIRG